MPNLEDAIAIIQASLPQQQVAVDPLAIIGALPILIHTLRENGVKVSGRAEMDMEGLDPLTKMGTKPAVYRVVIEFSL